MTTPADGATIAAADRCQRLDIVGACYYLTPDRFSERLIALARVLAGSTDTLTIRAISMRDAREELPAHAPISWGRSRGAFLDISAYQEGLKDVRPEANCILLNDTLFLRHPWKQVARSIAPLLPALSNSPMAAAAGEVHPSTDLLLSDPDNYSRRHLSTFCFAMNAASRSVFDEIMASLPTQETTTERSAWLSNQASRYPALGTLLHVHLEAANNPWTWRRRTNSTQPEMLARKAVTVAIEYLFTARLLERGGFVMPINSTMKYRFAARLAALRAH
jgi:hypothetical protein